MDRKQYWSQVLRAIASLVFLLLLLVTPRAFAQDIPASPDAFVFSWAYVAGGLGAIIFKMFVGVSKSLAVKRFRWRKLFWPTLVAIMLSFPLIFLVMPHARPTGNFMNDLIYAWLTGYTMLGTISDVISLYEVRQQVLLEATSKADNEETGKPS